MKKMLLAMLLAAGTLHAVADSYAYPYLAFQKADGTVVSIGVESLNMTFGDGSLLAANDQTSKTFVVSELTRMYFTTEDTGISGVVSDDADYGPARVYTPSGAFVGAFESLDEAKDAAKGGVFIIRQNGRTLKVIAR